MFLPAKCTGCWDKNSPRPKQHQEGLYRDKREGGRDGEEEGGEREWGRGEGGYVDGNPDAPALEEGFYQEITYSKAAVSTSPHHIIHL